MDSESTGRASKLEEQTTALKVEEQTTALKVEEQTTASKLEILEAQLTQCLHEELSEANTPWEHRRNIINGLNQVFSQYIPGFSGIKLTEDAPKEDSQD
ncbi:hypothetical protein IWW41_004085 [Coemansia sp. RSA 2522]|nr:hypothetical protein IWW41_004085 [Coemansia sp. RSA 2522]